MIIKTISLKNFKSFGNNKQTLTFNTTTGDLILLSGQNGGGKCLSPDTEIEIFIEDEETMNLLLEFLENRKKRFNRLIYTIKNIMKLNKDKFFKDFDNDYLISIDNLYCKNSISHVKTLFKNEFKILQEKNNLKRLTIRNIDYWIVRGWTLEDAQFKIEKIKNNWKTQKCTILNVEYWFNKGYNEREAKQKISEIQKNRSAKATKTRLNNPNYIPLISPFTSEYWIKQGITNKDEIKFKINSQRKLNTEYWLNKGFNEEDSILKVSEYQKENSIKNYKKWKNKRRTFEYKKSQNTHVEFYLNKGYTIEESKKLLNERQSTFTLEKCITKYGLEKGTEVYNKRQKKWVKKMFNENTCMAIGRSMIADKFVEELIKEINDETITNQFLYGNNERFIYDNIEKKGKKYDLCYDKKIIEFYGDFWHSNPKIFGENDIHRIKKIKCSEIWQFDKRKIESAKEHNYEVLIIWESEYINNQIEIIKKCKKFLINEN